MSEENKPVVFDPNKVMENIRTKVKEQLMALIPDDQMDEFIKAEYEKFFMDKTKTEYNRTITTPSEFSKICEEEMKVMMRQKIQEYFQSPKFSMMYDQSNMDKELEKTLTAMAPKMMGQMMMSLAASTVQSMQQGSFNANY